MKNNTVVLAIVCSLKPSPNESSSELMAKQLLDQFADQGAETELVRAADYNIVPGVKTDMGDEDDWPAIRQKMLDSDVLILSTPIWLGHPASYAQRVLERLDAELSEQDDRGRMLTYGKCAAVAVVGNEDGAHHVCAEVFQGLNDVGFSLAAGAAVYWNGEAMHTTDYKDLKSIPDKVATTQQTLVTNTLHLARLLKADAYPPVQ